MQQQHPMTSFSKGEDMMSFTKKITPVNDFILSSNKHTKITPLPRPPTKIIIITPNEMLMTGIKCVLKDNESINIIRTNTAIINSLFYWRHQEEEDFPHVILVDTQQRRISCYEFIIRFKNLNDKTKILVMGDQFRHEKLQEYFDAGADGYLDQAASTSTFVQAINTVVHDGKKFLFTPLLPFHGHIVLEPFEEDA